MRMAHDFGAVRLAAQHCPELVARGPRPEEREALIGAWRRELAQGLGETLGALLAMDRLRVDVSAPEWLIGSEVLTRIGPVAANSLLRCGRGGAAGESAEVLLSIDHATVLALAERSFGGDGRVGEPSLDPLPRSALLLCDEVALLVASGLAQARRGEAVAAAGEGTGEVIIRSENAARLRALDPARSVVMFTLRLSDARGHEWRILLALAAERLDALLPAPGTAPLAAAVSGRAQRDPAAQFGGIPLSLCAVLAQFEITLGQLERLTPGDTFPLPAPRNVPLKLGETLVAHGSIGTLDDHLAVCLTQVPNQGIAP